LELCEQHKLPRLVLRAIGESKLVINQMLGKAECRAHHLQPQLSRARELAAALRTRGCRISFQQVPRKENKEADAEANVAIKAQASHRTQDPGMQSSMCALRHGTADALFADPQDKKDKEQAPTLRKALRERLLRVPSHEALEALVKEMHLQSRALRALPPARLWPEHFKRSWEEACADFTAQLKAALDDGSELATLQIVLDFNELPCRVLLPLMEEEKKQVHKKADRPPGAIPDPLPSSERANPQQEAAKRRAYEDLWSKAMQALLSNGVAPATEETLQQMADMHGVRTEELQKHAPGPDKVTVKTVQAKSFLYKEAALDHTCLDGNGLPLPGPQHTLSAPSGPAVRADWQRRSARLCRGSAHLRRAARAAQGEPQAASRQSRARAQAQAQAGQHRLCAAQVVLQVCAARPGAPGRGEEDGAHPAGARR